MRHAVRAGDVGMGQESASRRHQPEAEHFPLWRDSELRDREADKEDDAVEDTGSGDPLRRDRAAQGSALRQQGGETAFVEGWALYSERLGKEVGFYTNPYNDYGRLNDEMLRAIRLVVDTGLHAKKWTRDDVVKFFRDHSAIDEVEIQAETDRYIVWPGQALAYKIGQLKILELRERAHRELGAKFDIRKFHDEILGAGALPMTQLEERIDAWIQREK